MQGVGFRFFAQRRGRSLGLKGYVRNQPDGTVEVLASGPEDLLRSFLEDLKEGPPASQVRSCRVDWIELSQPLPEFTIL